MNRKNRRTRALRVGVVVVLTAFQAQAQDAKPPYPNMARLTNT